MEDVVIPGFSFNMKKFHRRSIDPRRDFGDEFTHLVWGADLGWPNPPSWTQPSTFSPIEKRCEVEVDLGFGGTRGDTSRDRNRTGSRRRNICRGLRRALSVFVGSLTVELSNGVMESLCAGRILYGRGGAMPGVG